MSDDIRVVDNPARNRFEIYRGDALAGFVIYELSPGVITFIHTEVDPSFNGQGLGSQLVAQALSDARSRDLKIVPVCPFVRRYLEKHPS
jgi:predicted GNAT family acetyltransferase